MFFSPKPEDFLKARQTLRGQERERGDRIMIGEEKDGHITCWVWGRL